MRFFIDIFKKYWKSLVKIKHIRAIFTVVVFLLILFFWNVLTLKADSVNFYSTSCLGGWKSTSLAQGEPEIFNNSGEFNSKNSSISLNDSVSQIFCGNFRGSIVENTEVKKIIVHFSWAETDSEPTEELPPTVTGESFASSTDEIINIPDNSDTNSQFILQSADTTVESPVLQDGDDVIKKDEKEQVQESSLSEPSSEETSFLDFFVKTAHADTIVTEDIFLDQSTSTMDFSTSTDQTASVIQAINDDSISDEPFLEVKYTIDGTNWTTLGKVNRKNFSDITFELPPSDFTNWTDLSQLQISVERLATINKSPYVYLDSMWLEVMYEHGNFVEKPNEDLTEKILHFTPGLTTNTVIKYLIKTDVDKKETLNISAEGGGSLKIYGVTDPNFSMTIGIGDDPVEFSGYSFPPGKYFLIYTKQSDACSDMTLYQCASDSGFIDKLDFTVNDRPNVK